MHFAFIYFLVLYCIYMCFSNMSVACWALCYLFLNKIFTTASHVSNCRPWSKFLNIARNNI